MLHHLTQPYVLLGVLAALLVGVPAHNLAQAGLALALGDRTPRQNGFLQLRLTRHFSVFGLIPMLIVSYGWGFAEPVAMTPRYYSRRGRVALALAAGPLTYLLLCELAITGLKLDLRSSLVSGSVFALPLNSPAAQISLSAAITLAGLCILSLVPVPPLDGGRILFTLAPPSRGWQQARYQLEERNIGLAIALAVVILPLVFPGFPSVVGQLAGPLLNHLAQLTGLG